MKTKIKKDGCTMISRSEILDKEEIVKRINNDENINDIAKELNYDLSELMEGIGKEYYYSESSGQIQKKLSLKEIIDMLNSNTSMEDVARLIDCNSIELKGEIQKRYYYSESKKHWFSLHEIVTQRLNKRESFKEVAKDIGFESDSTFRKRVEKEYYWSSADKCFLSKMYREEFGLEEFDVLRTSADSLEETQILIMERYKDKDYWREEEYNCFGEKCIKEECILIEHLDRELTEDAEKLGISKSEVIQLYLLRYLSKNRKRKGSGLKFEREYKKTTQEIHEDIMAMGVEQYMKRQWPKLLEDE
ncbi:hypothetical protein [Clostridium sp. C2-6-12]|uniref:hypothetical protein n=1 Tax=Clostridium sp. C2-6-12 TaxID=2698832 RepID=UPI0013710436|nr:hypothetical protein [Clostridium sp. C2-6-12]